MADISAVLAEVGAPGKNRDEKVQVIKDEKGYFIPREGDIFNVKPFVISPQAESRLWFKRDYYDSLCRLVENEESNTLDTEHTLRYKSLRYGEITIAERDKDKEFVYSDQFGLTLKTQN